MNKSGRGSDGREMVSARGPKDSGSEQAAAGAREEGESDEENLTLSVDSQERFEARERRGHPTGDILNKV